MKNLSINNIFSGVLFFVAALLLFSGRLYAQNVTITENFNVPTETKYADLNYTMPYNGTFLSQTGVLPTRSVNGIRINAAITTGHRDFCENVYFQYYVYYEDGSRVHGAQANRGSYSDLICWDDNTVSERSPRFSVNCMGGTSHLTATIPTQLFEYRSGTTRYKYRIHVWGNRLTEDGEETNIRTTDFWSGWRYFTNTCN